MAVFVQVNGGSTLSFGTGTPTEAAQQLSTAEINPSTDSTDVKTYGGSTAVSGQSKRVLHIVGLQDWGAGAGSVCDYLETNEGTWVDFEYDQYGGGTAGPTNPIVTGQALVTAPKRGGVIDEPETFELEFGIKGYTVTKA